MTDILRRYATPFITGLFLVSLVSGVALFFHVGQAAFHGMHEWLSMVLILPFVLHLWRNWRAMMTYVGRAPLTLAMALSIAAGLVFAIPALTGTAGSGGPPHFALAQTVLAHGARDVAPILGLTAEELVAGLKAKGYSAAAPDEALKLTAEKSGRDSAALIAALLEMKK